MTLLPTPADLKFAKKVRTDRQSLIWLLVGCLCLLLLFLPTKNRGAQETTGKSTPNPETDPFSGLQILAKAACVLDGKTGQTLYDHNCDAQLPLASLTKVMTAVTALAVVPEGTIIPINRDSIAQEGDSGLMASESFSLRQLLALTLAESSNDGAYAIAAVAGATLGDNDSESERIAAFVTRMNETGKQLDLAQTYFLNPTGLDLSREVSGGYGSARDLSALTAFAIKKYPEIFETTSHSNFSVKSEESKLHEVENTNVFVDKIPNLIASKTGFTDLAGGNLVIAFNADFDHPIIISVLGSTREGRFTDTEQLVWASLKKLTTQN